MSTRTAIRMTDDEVRAFVAAGRILVLVTLGPDGAPDPVPMWFVPDPETGMPLMRTYAKSQKVVNLRRDPRFAGLVEAGERYAELRGVQLTGTVALDADPDAVCDVVAGLAVKYEGVPEEHRDAAREAARAQAHRQVVLRLQVERVVSWDHRKLGATG